MHQTSSPYHVGAGRNRYFGAETFFCQRCCDTLFWPIGPCTMLSPIWTHPRVGARPSLPNEDMPSIHSSSNETPLDIAGPITRSRAKQLQKEIHSQVNANLMFNNQSMLNEPMLLSSCFNVLRNDGVYEPAWDQDGFKPLDI